MHRTAASGSGKQLKAATVLTDLTDLANGADGALELGVVLAAVEGARLEGRAAVDGRVGGGADVELGKLVELDLDSVVGVALALGLDLLCLFIALVWGPVWGDARYQDLRYQQSWWHRHWR